MKNLSKVVRQMELKIKAEQSEKKSNASSSESQEERFGVDLQESFQTGNESQAFSKTKYEKQMSIKKVEKHLTSVNNFSLKSAKERMPINGLVNFQAKKKQAVENKNDSSANNFDPDYMIKPKAQIVHNKGKGKTPKVTLDKDKTKNFTSMSNLESRGSQRHDGSKTTKHLPDYKKNDDLDRLNEKCETDEEEIFKETSKL